MHPDNYANKARQSLETICSVQPNRRTGSAGNRQATEFFASTLRGLGYAVDATPFECLDHICDGAWLSGGDQSYEVQASPYTLGCDVSAELVAVSTHAGLESTDFSGKLLLLHGDICAEQLMPKNFVFYNPEQHQQIIARLESGKPAGIITATGENPELVGALVPFPLIVDGDFDIPSVYCLDTLGAQLATRVGEVFHLKIAARRLPSTASNIIARLNSEARRKVVFTAHIDAYEDAPGAVDNAAGTVVLLLLAEMLADYRGETGIEIAAFNGEDHYSAGGQMDYLRRYAGELPAIRLAVNIDDAGFQQGRTAYSFYSCEAALETRVEAVMRRYAGLTRGEAWYQGDHMVFVQNQVPALACASECMAEVMRRYAHTAADTPAIVDCNKLVELATALDALARAL